ncbi:PEP-CTERM sorting domain-containing protein [Crateriforma spongiae]|uniref:PEP-CTERM sorting domain-containing protein n=1 Tax=Crateriforma spongiae TaxID=2724528 RepID=UPI0039AF05A3
MKHFVILFTGLIAAVLSSPAPAAISAFSDDFQSTGATFSPWVVFSDNGGFPGGYFIAEPATNNAQIFQLADDGAGNQYLNFFANYDNAAVHNRSDPGQDPMSPNAQEAISFFVEYQFTAADTASGDTWTFDFDYAFNPAAPPAGDTEVGAFIRVFDPAFNLLGGDTLDTSDATGAFQSASTLSVTLDPTWAEGRIQFGFNNLVGNYDGSGMFYDNVEFRNASAVPEPSTVAFFSIGMISVATRRRLRQRRKES